MEAKFFILLISLLVAPSINAQNINCIFTVVGTNYDCVLSQLFIPDNEQLNFNVVGQHQPGQNNAGVTRVIITNSLVPFVIRQFFTTFTNLREYHYTDSAFETRVQTNAFQGITGLTDIVIARVANLTIQPNGLNGATGLLRLGLQTNHLTAFPAAYIAGLNNLLTIDISGNHIEAIPDTLFRAQTSLTAINVNNNLLRRLPNTLLTTNTNLVLFSAQSNQIFQIGRQFLNGLTGLTSLSLSGNECINQNWFGIGGPTGPSFDTINQALAACFDNYQGSAEWRAFGLHLRGSIRLFDEDNNLVGQL